MSEREVPSAEEWNKAERLHVAGKVAPIARSMATKAANRKVKLYNRETGEVTGEKGGLEWQKEFFAAHAIEIELVDDSKKPDYLPCEFCSKLVPQKTRTKRQSCLPEAGGCFRQSTCAACDAPPVKGAFYVWRVKLRGASPWICFACTMRKRGEKRSENSRRKRRERREGCVERRRRRRKSERLKKKERERAGRKREERERAGRKREERERDFVEAVRDPLWEKTLLPSLSGQITTSTLVSVLLRAGLVANARLSPEHWRKLEISMFHLGYVKRQIRIEGVPTRCFVRK